LSLNFAGKSSSRVLRDILEVDAEERMAAKAEAAHVEFKTEPKAQQQADDILKQRMDTFYTGHEDAHMVIAKPYPPSV
jgi:hypothetical protein